LVLKIQQLKNIENCKHFMMEEDLDEDESKDEGFIEELEVAEEECSLLSL